MAAGPMVTLEVIDRCQSMARRGMARQQIAYALKVHKSTVGRILDGTVLSALNRRQTAHRKRVAADRIRSEDATYWITRAPVPGRGMVYTAAYRPQDLKRDGVHPGCHLEAAAAKAACERHAIGDRP